MELTPQQEVVLGRAASELLKVDSVFTQAVSALEGRYRAETKATGAGYAGRDLREALYAKECALDDIRNELRAMEGNGELAARQIAEQEKRKQ